MPEVQCALGQRHAERKGLHRRGHPRHLREGQGAAAWVAPVGSPTFLYIIKLVDPHRDPHGKLAAKRKSHPTGTQFYLGDSMLLPKYSLIAYSSAKHNDFHAAES